MAGLVLGVLAVFSIGLLVLVGAFLAGGAYIINLTRVKDGPGWRSSGFASIVGGLAGVVAVGAVFVPSMFPHVDCQPGGVHVSSGWGLFGGSSGGGMTTGSADGRTITGSGFGNGHSYHFTCRDGKLVEFTQQ